MVLIEQLFQVLLPVQPPGLLRLALEGLLPGALRNALGEHCLELLLRGVVDHHIVVMRPRLASLARRLASAQTSA